MWALSRLAARQFGQGTAAGQSNAAGRGIGIALFTDHAFAFEVTSVLILVAMVGAVVLAKKHV